MSNNGKHILLIDDDTDMHDVVRLMLEPLGYQLSCATTREAGVQTMRSQPPDLLLLDVMLSTPTEGLDLARELRRDDQFRNLPIIMVSSTPRDTGFGNADDDDDGPDQFLEKPLDARKLRQVIADVLRDS